MAGFDSVTFELCLGFSKKKKLLGRARVLDGTYQIGDYVRFKFNPKIPSIAYFTIHLASLLHGENILLITTADALDAIDNASSIIGIDISNARLLGFAIAGNVLVEGIVRNYYDTLCTRYRRIINSQFPHTRYINDAKGEEGDISRIFYDKLFEEKKEEYDGHLLRFEVKIRRNLRRHLLLPRKDFIIPILSDLADQKFWY